MGFARIVDAYEAPLVRFALRYVGGDLEQARDAVQETFLRLCRENWARLENEERLRPWLFRVCRQRAIDLARKHRPLATDPAMLEPHPPDAARHDPAQILIGEESRRALRHALQRLPDKEREVVVLKFQDGRSYREISELTGFTIDHVGVLIHRGVQRLRATLS